MDKPSTSQASMDKVEMYEVREHVPYQAEVTRAPTTYDAESGDMYDSSWHTAWIALCQLFNLVQHMMSAIVVFCLWHFALTVSPNGQINNLQLHIVFAGTGYQLFLVEAVLTLHKHNSWTSQLSSDGKKIVHGCLQLIGAVFVMAGTFLALSEVNMTLNTPHGICALIATHQGGFIQPTYVGTMGMPPTFLKGNLCMSFMTVYIIFYTSGICLFVYTILKVDGLCAGIIAFIFTVISFVSGIVTLFSSKVRLLVKTGPIKILHIAVGLFAISLGLVTITTGFHMSYFRAGRETLSSSLMAFVVIILAYVLVQPLIDLVSTTRKSL